MCLTPVEQTPEVTEPTVTSTTTDGVTRTTTPPGEGDWKQTVIYMQIDTSPGQDGFLRGGLNENQDGRKNILLFLLFMALFLRQIYNLPT